MTGSSPQFAGATRSSKEAAARLRQEWARAYGQLLSLQLEPARRYSVLRVGFAEFAYSRYDQFVEALAHAWSAGHAVEQRPSVLGSELPGAAPGLRAVDADLSTWDPANLAAPTGLL